MNDVDFWNATTGCMKIFGLEHRCKVGQKRLDVAEDIFVVLSGFVAQWHEPHEAGSWRRHSSYVISCDLGSPYQRSETIWNVFDVSRSEKCVASTCAEWSDCCRPSGLLWHGLEAGRGSWRLHTSNIFKPFWTQSHLQGRQGQVTDPNRPSTGA